MGIKNILINWIEQDLLTTIKYISTSDNYSDSMEKTLGKQLHYQNFDYIMGRIRPKHEPSPIIVLFLNVRSENHT
jgi:hypothetical protein